MYRGDSLIGRLFGLPDVSIKESKERVRAAIKNSNHEIYSRRIIVNLSPADIRKEGSSLDLPIAIGVLLGMEEIINKKDIDEVVRRLNDTVFVGELSLDGKLNHINGILPICVEAKRLGIKRIIVPIDNLREASIVSDISCLGAKNLNEVIEFLQGKNELEELHTNWNGIDKNYNRYNIDFADVKGQENVKRAVEIAASGGHNILLSGSPGCGKSMIAKRIPTILPDLSFEESLETTKIHSISGKLKEDILLARPFRCPHHTISIPSLIGGGIHLRPGEISMAHNGVLYLDEIAEFKKNTLEVLRGPIEDKQIIINRNNQSLTYPCNFMLVASMNPCPCGYYGSNIKECICSLNDIKRYNSKISGPLLDRIDIQVEVQSVIFKKIDQEGESSSRIKERVSRARYIQQERYKNENVFSNAQLSQSQIETYCKIDEESKKLLEMSFNRLGLSVRAYSKILKVARTIADLEGKENVEKKHIAEAIQYRSLDKRYLNCN